MHFAPSYEYILNKIVVKNVTKWFSTGSIPGGLTATLALHKWRSKNVTFETPLYLWIHELYYESNIANRLVLLSIAYIQKLNLCIYVCQ